jgi:hypothetical protein
MAFSIGNSVLHDPQRERLTLGRLRHQSGAVPNSRQMNLPVTVAVNRENRIGKPEIQPVRECGPVASLADNAAFPVAIHFFKVPAEAGHFSAVLRNTIRLRHQIIADVAWTMQSVALSALEPTGLERILECRQ